MSWLRRCSSALLVLALTGCASAPEPKPAAEPKPVEAKVPPAAQTTFDQALGLLREKRYGEAATALAALTAEFPQFPGAWANLGVAYAENQQPEAAVTAWEKALTLSPGHPVAANRLAILHRQAGRFERARELYQALLAAHPQHRLGHRNLGILCDLYLQDLACALEHYRAYQGLGEEDPEVAKWLVDLERRMGETR